MWLAIILTTLFGGIGILITYGVYALEQVDFDLYEMDRDEFRHKVIGEEYEDGYGSRGWFTSPISKEAEKKYQQYLAKIKKKSKRRKVFFYVLPVIIFMFLLFWFAKLGAFIDKQNLGKEIARYEASKYTIEMSLENADLTGLERIELVKQATEKNEWLAQKKYEVQQWFNFHLDKDLVLQLKEINLNK